MKTTGLFLLVLLLIFTGSVRSQKKWQVNGKIDTFVIGKVVSIDIDKSYIYGYKRNADLSYVKRWFSSYGGWSPVSFDGISDLGEDQYVPNLQVSAPQRIYGFIGGIGPQSGVILSNDTGKTWRLISSTPPTGKLSRGYNSFTVTEHNQAVYLRHDTALMVSGDGCKTFSAYNNDTAFKNTVARFSDNGSDRLAWYDFTHWTYALQEHTPPTNEPGLTTLVSSNIYSKWQKYNYLIPGHEDKSINGHLQSIKNTSTVFYVPGSYHGSSAFASYPSSVRFGISFLTSTDYGATWKPNYSFGHRRRAFYAVSEKEIWMTVSSTDTLFYDGKANWIVHSTDGGQTWDIDSSTLYIQDLGYCDGVNLSFYDNKHGWLSANNNGDGYVFRFLDTAQTSVEEIEHSQDYVRQVFKIYPNPSKDKVNLLIGADKQIQSIRLYDILGKEYIPAYTLQKANEAIVDLGDVPSGVYLVKLKNQFRYYTLPLVVTKN